MKGGSQPAGATPLTPDDLQGLKSWWVTTQEELNRVEAENVLRGRIWASGRAAAPFWCTRDPGLQLLHRRMFGDVWDWAGTLRRRETNVGVDPRQIAMALRDLGDDTAARIGDGSRLAYPVDELAVRFHHRLVLIHPFPNGNGRHARLATDLLLRDLGAEPFTWGGGALTDPTELRQDYLSALRRADRTADVAALLDFARRPL